MTNPYAWAFLGACTIFSVVFGIWQWYKSKRKKELSCYKNSYTIVKGGKSLLPDLELKYKNEPIQELVITKYAIWNSGNEVLQREDIVEIKPLQVSCNGENTRILDVKILQESDETNQFVVVDMDKQHARINFDYVAPKDGIVIQMMHTGESQDVMVECKIKGGKSVKPLNKDKKYKKAVQKGWKALKSYVHEDGMLGYVQPVSAAPEKVTQNMTEVYGVGAFLMAGIEMLKMR